MSVSSLRGLFQHLTKISFYRLPKRMGWPFADTPLGRALEPDHQLDLHPLHQLLQCLPCFFPGNIRSHLTTFFADPSHPCAYTMEALTFIINNGIRPGIPTTL